ncbi:MAG: glycosyltransferase [Flavisolibacter sp.]
MAEGLINNRDFILFGLQPWDIGIGSNFKNMAREIAKHNRVLYVNYPADRISIIRNKHEQRIKNRMAALREGKNVLKEEFANLWVLNPQTIVESINYIPFASIYDKLNFINNRRLALKINNASNQLGFRDPILVIDNDFLRGFYLPNLIPNQAFVFYIRDYLLSQPYFKKHGSRLESKMIKKANAVACNSTYLASYARELNAKSYDIGQGCDIDTFLQNRSERPEEIRDLKGPLIGYCGALLSSRLDIDLIEYIAKDHNDWNFVFVGPEDQTFRNSRLHQMKNIVFTGAMPFESLPGFVHHFDVCINPQLVNQMTLGNYPRKIDEYLAAGKPVVATYTPAMEPFSNYVYLSHSANEFNDYLNVAMQDQVNVDIHKRVEFAKSHTWEASVEKLYEIIHSLIKNEKVSINREVEYDQ